MYYLSESQESLKKEIRNFVENEIAPIASTLDASGVYPKELIKRIFSLGCPALVFPREYGGSGKGILEETIFLEEISRGMGSLGFIFCAHILPCCYMAMNYVTPKQRDEWLIPAIKGDKLLTFAISEERGGSEAFGIDTIAERHPKGWILNGSKCWITNAGVADGYIINARTSTNSRSRMANVFYVDARLPGVTVTKSESMTGLNNSPTGTVEFNNCLLPYDALICEESMGYEAVKTSLNYGRLGLAAVSVGMAQSAFEKAAEFASKRMNYDRSLFAFQGVSFPIAEMYSNISIARSMLYHVAALSDAGKKASMETASIKLFASEMCQKVCRDAALIHGGQGFRKHSDIERLLRDSQLLTVAEGTSQICKVVISNGVYNNVLAGTIKDFI